MPILEAETNIFPADLLSRKLSTESERSWKVVYTMSRQEKSLARHLLQNETPYYLPLIPKDNLIRGRCIRSHLPLFTGYVFLYCTEEERIKALTSNRISQIMSVEDGETLQSDLNQIKELIDADVRLSLESKISPGQRVRVKRGPFEGLEGIVIHRCKKSRLQIAVNYLQQGVSMEIDDFLLEAI